MGQNAADPCSGRGYRAYVVNATTAETVKLGGRTLEQIKYEVDPDDVFWCSPYMVKERWLEVGGLQYKA